MSNPQTFDVGIDFQHVLAAISKQIYDTPLAFLRENVQNSVDAVRLQALRDARDPGDPAYRIDINLAEHVCRISDNGIGMTPDDLRKLFWTIGASGKRTAEARKAGCVGMFGIGGFANFGVCTRLDVRSRVSDGPKATHTWLAQEDIQSSGARLPQVHVTDSAEPRSRGTQVVGMLRSRPNADELRKYLEDFVEHAAEHVYFGGKLISRRSSFDATGLGVEAFRTWKDGKVEITAAFLPPAPNDRNVLRAALSQMRIGSEVVSCRGIIRYENGPLDVFKRGFKICSTKVITTIGVSGRLDCDRLTPTAGRDSLDAESSSLLNQVAAICEREGVREVLRSVDRISHYTRIFSYVTRNGLLEDMVNVHVRLADGSEKSLGDIRQLAKRGQKVYFGTTTKQTLAQIFQARGNVMVIVDGDHGKQQAQRAFLERFCGASKFDGMVECCERYEKLDRFEQVVMAELERAIANAYNVDDVQLVAGRMTEDVPVFVADESAKLLTIYVDVRHGEVVKMRALGLTPLLYSVITAFCSEYLGPVLRKRSPKFFGNGGLNLDWLAARRSELWILLRDDVQVVTRGARRDVVRSGDVQVVRVGAQVEQTGKIPKIVRVVDEQGTSEVQGAYIRVPESASKAFGDLIKECMHRGVVWAGNKILMVASDGISSTFQFEIRLDGLIKEANSGRSGAEGSAELRRPIQEMHGGLYFPLAPQLEGSLIPGEGEEIRIEVHCDWMDLESSRSWTPA